MEGTATMMALAKLREDMDAIFVMPPEGPAFQDLLQRQFETVAIRRDDEEEWGVGNRQKVRGVLLTGQPRVGKSELAENAALGLVDIATASGITIEPNHFTVECPSIFTHGLLFNEFLVRMGWASRPLPRAAAWTRIEQKLSFYRRTLLVLDECQNAFNPSGVGKSRVDGVNVETAGIFRRWMDHPDWSLPICFVALPYMIDVLKREDMAPLRERIDVFQLKPMSDGPEEVAPLHKAITDFCVLAEISCGIVDANFYPRLIHAAGHARGLAIQLAKDAVVEAWRGESKTLSVSHFTSCYRNSTGASDNENPFVVPAWNQTDRSRLLDALLEVSKPGPPPKARRGQ